MLQNRAGSGRRLEHVYQLRRQARGEAELSKGKTLIETEVQSFSKGGSCSTETTAKWKEKANLRQHEGTESILDSFLSEAEVKSPSERCGYEEG